MIGDFALKVSRRHGVQARVLLAAAFACIVCLPTVLSLGLIWGDATDRPTYKHGYLILAVSLWLLVTSRFSGVLVRPEWRALPLVVALSLLWVITDRGGIQIAGQVLLPMLIWSAVLLAAGWGVARVVAFPVAYLYFAVPVWDLIMTPLALLTTQVNGLWLAIAGIPAVIDVNHVEIAAGSFVVEDGCSGVHYLIVALALATFHGQIDRCTLKQRIALLALAAFLALFTNWVRVFSIIVAGHLTDMQHFLVRTDHYYFGWVLFLIALVIYFVLAHRWVARAPAPAPLAVEAAEGGDSWKGWIAAIIALGAAPAVSQAAHLGPVADRVNLDAPSVRGWTSERYQGTWSPHFPNANGQLQVRYDQPGAAVFAYAATYLRQTQGHEVSGYENSVFGSSGWKQSGGVGSNVLSVPSRELPFLESEAVDPSGKRYALRWTYLVGERAFASSLRSKVWYGIASIGSDPAASIVAIATECQPDCAAARDTLTRFTKDALSPEGG